jgi:hypothetical protein
VSCLMADETFPLAEMIKSFFLCEAYCINVHRIWIADNVSDSRCRRCLDGVGVVFEFANDGFDSSVLSVELGSCFVPSCDCRRHFFHHVDFFQ